MDTGKEILPPKASSIISSLRSIGYSIETAIADLVDNSISAGASRIDIDSPFRGTDTSLTIFDNGCGMDEETLHAAMRLGSSNPNEERQAKDLGRFGLGLKTASFSQCKRFTVMSKRNGVICSRTWDLDIIVSTDDWTIIKDINPQYVERFENIEHGTLVIWEKLDRVISDRDKRAQEHFNKKKKQTKEHLSLTFHRFLEREKYMIEIYMAGNKILPWNPFLPNMNSKYKKTAGPAMTLCGGNLEMQGIIMPHKSYFTTEAEYNEAAQNKNWTMMQGFYIYRADRLLVAGDWLGLKRHSKYYDLARIRVDITNGYDFDWDIDVKKSKATPPDYLVQKLQELADATCKSAYETYRYRGKEEEKTTSTGRCFEKLWHGSTNHGKVSFSLNSNHPYIQSLMNDLNDSQTNKLKNILRLIAATLPYERIDFLLHENENIQPENEFSKEENMFENEVIKDLIQSFLSQGYTFEEAKEHIKILTNVQ